MLHVGKTQQGQCFLYTANVIECTSIQGFATFNVYFQRCHLSNPYVKCSPFKALKFMFHYSLMSHKMGNLGMTLKAHI